MRYIIPEGNTAQRQSLEINSVALRSPQAQLLIPRYIQYHLQVRSLVHEPALTYQLTSICFDHHILDIVSHNHYLCLEYPFSDFHMVPIGHSSLQLNTT